MPILEAERRADRHHPLADLERGRFADLHDRQVGGVDLQHGNIALRVHTEHARLEFAAIGELHRDALGAVHHVCVGEDDAVGADDEPGAFAAHRGCAGRDHGHAEVAEQRVVLVHARRQRPSRRGLAVGPHAHVDHGGAVAAHQGAEIGGGRALARGGRLRDGLLRRPGRGQRAPGILGVRAARRDQRSGRYQRHGRAEQRGHERLANERLDPHGDSPCASGQPGAPVEREPAHQYLGAT